MKRNEFRRNWSSGATGVRESLWSSGATGARDRLEIRSNWRSVATEVFVLQRVFDSFQDWKSIVLECIAILSM